MLPSYSSLMKKWSVGVFTPSSWNMVKTLNYFLSCSMSNINFFGTVCNFDNSFWKSLLNFKGPLQRAYLNSSLIVVIFWCIEVKEAKFVKNASEEREK